MATAGSSDQTSKRTVGIAHWLRRDTTDAEVKLWGELRNLNQRGLHFRQQAPVGRFITDFCEHTHKLIIEVDGGHHGEPATAARDTERTAWLESQGCSVIRFSNTEIFTRFEGVIIEIMIATGTLPYDSSVVADPDAEPVSRPRNARFIAVEAKRRRCRMTPSPLVGEGWGGGACPAPTIVPPTPNPSPQGGGGFTASPSPDASGAGAKDTTP